MKLFAGRKMNAARKGMDDKKVEAKDEKKATTDPAASETAVPGNGAGEEPAADQSVKTPEKPSQPPEEAIDTVDDLKQQMEAQSDRYLRLMAEFDNFKKRVSRDYERLVESANERLIGEMIEVRENFERALKSGDQCADLKTLLDGMKMIYTKFDGVLTKNGLEPFGAVGEPFDPQLHDALMKTPHDTIAEDHIADVFEKGYRLKNRVIRHAKVIVSGGAPKTDVPAGKESSSK
jgi:molecular chaperone GrpE